MKQQFEKAAEKAPTEAKIAQNVEELAQWIGCQPEVLRAELDSCIHSLCSASCYNVFCRNA